MPALDGEVRGFGDTAVVDTRLVASVGDRVGGDADDGEGAAHDGRADRALADAEVGEQRADSEGCGGECAGRVRGPHSANHNAAVWGLSGTGLTLCAMDKGSVNWIEAEVTWDGKSYSLTVPHSIPDPEAAWLEENLDEALTAAGLDLDAYVRVTAGRELIIGGLTEDWPDAGRLREVVGYAVEEAYQRSRHAAGQAQHFQGRLRGW